MNKTKIINSASAQLRTSGLVSSSTHAQAATTVMRAQVSKKQIQQQHTIAQE